MNQPDIRWQQRFANFRKALLQLAEAVDLSRQRPLSKLEQQGLIQAFEYTYELAWNVFRDFLVNQGNKNIYGSRDAIREAFKANLIEDGEGWMDMFKDRNMTSHTYNEDTANEIAEKIITRYYPLALEFENKGLELLGADQQQ